MTIYVVGSGPAGVAAASALLERGVAVTMLDVGLELEAEKRILLEKAKTEQGKEHFQKLKHKLNSKNPIKLNYGSDFPYAEVSKHFYIDADEHIQCLPSFAKGGLSNIWGAFVDRYYDEELVNWPINADQLNLCYDQVYRMMGVAINVAAATITSQDSIMNVYQSSQQARKLLERMTANQSTLQQSGMEFGTPIIATQFNTCIYCGSCQHGCPLELIYSSTKTLQELLKHPKFSYRKNVIVENFIENEVGIKIIALDRLAKERIEFDGTQVFLGCGPVISTWLVLKALQKPQAKATFHDSSHFMFPCIMRDRVKHVTKEKLYTMCQLYLEVNHPEVSSKPIHLQVYTFMDHYSEKFRQMLKGMDGVFSPLLKSFLNRLVVIQGQLDSEESHRFNMQLQKQNANGVQLTSELNPNAHTIVKRLLKHLKKNSKATGLIPITQMLQFSKICKSFHYGASLPMRTHPKELETDIYGKPTGLKWVHVIDASVFPTIPAGSITPTIMANAYRIAKESQLYE